jgi:ketopantoate reductase
MKSMEEKFSQRHSQYSTSPLRDIERGEQTEVERILGFMLGKPEEAKIHVVRCYSPTPTSSFRATARRRLHSLIL